MTGIPDAVVEAAARAIHYEYPETGHTWPCDACMSDARAALEAAEGPWREHLATQIEAERDEVTKGTRSDSIPKTTGRLWGLRIAAQIVRGTNEAS